MTPDHGWFRLDLVPVPDDLEHHTIELLFMSGNSMRGWMSKQFLGGRPTFWVPGWVTKCPVCVEPIAWRQAEEGAGHDGAEGDGTFGPGRFHAPVARPGCLVGT